MKFDALDFYISLTKDTLRSRIVTELKINPSDAAPIAVAESPFDPMLCGESAEMTALRDYAKTPLEPGALQLLGAKLGDILLAGETADHVFAAAMRPSARNAPVRLCLEITDDELSALPWECAYLSAPPPALCSPGYLCQMRRFHVLRYSHSEREQFTPKPLSARLKILIAWSSPDFAEYPRLSEVEPEKSAVRSALSHFGWQIEVEEVQNANRKTLRQAIEGFKPDVLHLICHGDEENGGRLLLHRVDGEPEYWLPGKSLANWLDPAITRMVVLSACSSSGTARSIVKKGVPAVLAMHLPFRDEHSEGFFNSFYSALSTPSGSGTGSDIAEALFSARRAIGFKNGPDWGVPSLWTSAPVAQLFEITPPSNAPRLPELSDYCIGRENELLDLHSIFFPAEMGPRAPRAALVGMGGVGKTTLAYQYVQRYQNYYPDHVYWLSVKHVQELESNYSRLFGIPKGDVPPLLEARVAQVRQQLQDLPRPALLVFDNVDDEAGAAIILEKLLPATGRCRILITSREPALWNHTFRRISVPSLDEESAIDVMKHFRDSGAQSKHPGFTLSAKEEEAARTIVRRMGGLPLALELIGADIGLDRSFTDYLDNQQENHEKSIRGKLRAHLASSLSRMSSQSARLLGLASCLSGESIPEGLLFDIFERAFGQISRMEFLEAKRSLLGISLISLEGVFAGEPLKNLRMHEVVRDLAYDQLSVEVKQKQLAAAVDLLSERFQKENAETQWPEGQSCLRHAYAIAERCRSDREAAEPGILVPLLLAVGDYQFEHSYFAAAAAHFTEALQLQSACPLRTKKNRQLIAAAHLKAAAAQQRLYDIGVRNRETVRDEAQKNAEQALKYALQNYKSDSLELVEFYNQIGYILKMQYSLDEALLDPIRASNMLENLRQAEPYYERSLEICRGTPQSPPLATCYNYLGVLYEEMARLGRDRALLEQARTYLEQALKIDESVRKPGHVNIAIRCNNLGRVTALQGNYSEALDLHFRAQEIYEDALGKDNKDVADSYFYMAQAYKGLGRTEEALMNLDTALSLYRRIYSYEDDHPFIAEKKRRFDMQADSLCW